MKKWPYPKLFAHRGGGSLAPENTLAAVKLGQSLGYHAHEFDVKLSKDNVALLLHDATLERTTNGKGRACDLTWKELSAFDAGSWHSAAFRGEPIASFEAVAKQLVAMGDMANVEIKPTPGFERETGAVVAREAAKRWKGAKVPPLLSSFAFEALLAAKKAAPGFRAAGSSGNSRTRIGRGSRSWRPCRSTPIMRSSTRRTSPGFTSAATA